MKKITFIAHLIFTFSLLTFNSLAQSKVDSLKQLIATTKYDTNKVKILNSLAVEYQRKNPDTSLIYANQALEQSTKLSYERGKAFSYKNIGNTHKEQGSYDKAIEYYHKALKIYKELGDKKEMSDCYMNIGVVHKNQGSFEKAIEYYHIAFETFEELADKKGMSACFGNIGLIHYYHGAYDKAIEYYHKSLKIFEELGNKKGMSACYNNIGIVHNDQGTYDKAIEYYHKSLKIYEEQGDKIGMSASYNNIGLVHSNQGFYYKDNLVKSDSLFNKSIEYYNEALKITEELSNKKGMSDCYNNIGNIYKKQGSSAKDPKVRADKYDKAIEYYHKSLKIDEELNDKHGIALMYANFTDLYIALADTITLTKNQGIDYLHKAVEYGIKSIKLAREIEAMPRENSAAKKLMRAYKKLGNYKKAIEFAEIFISTRDSMFSEEKTKALTEMQVKYEAEKKQLQIEKMEKQKLLDKKTIEAQQAQNRKQLVIIFSAFAGFVIVLVFSIIILRMFRQKRRANILLAQQNEEINQQNEEISSQRDEIEAQRDLAANQRDLIAEQKEELTDSIHYAYRIQSAVIPEDEYISSLLSDYFILYKPRDIVSGDFYWIGKQDNMVIVLAVDCTGHGVPGAFMSMLGVAFLNEIVNKENITSPADILNKLREYIIKALKQKGKEGESKDGMDVAAITIDTKTNKLEYSGANNPLYIIKNEELIIKNDKIIEFKNQQPITSNQQLYEIKPSKQPVAIYENMKPFINHEINLQKGDTIYIFSDGYADQFGGEKGKKFKYKPFKRLLLENINKPMKEQREILDKTFKDWKGDLDQIDDVCVIGIRI